LGNLLSVCSVSHPIGLSKAWTKLITQVILPIGLNTFYKALWDFKKLCRLWGVYIKIDNIENNIKNSRHSPTDNVDKNNLEKYKVKKQGQHSTRDPFIYGNNLKTVLIRGSGGGYVFETKLLIIFWPLFKNLKIYLLI